MSHTTTLKGTVIRDAAALKAAVAELIQGGVQCELLENAKPRMYYEHQHGTCDYVLRLADSRFDVGFDRQADGSYLPVFDDWNRHVGNEIGADATLCPMPDTAEGRAQHSIGQLLQMYAKHAAMNVAVAQGHMVSGAHVDDKGNIHLRLLVA